MRLKRRRHILPKRDPIEGAQATGDERAPDGVTASRAHTVGTRKDRDGAVLLLPSATRRAALPQRVVCLPKFSWCWTCSARLRYGATASSATGWNGAYREGSGIEGTCAGKARRLHQ
ncbi:hypothetical protein GUJ93_ZPchr0013g34031 [Zizania palustris]|uniref:Uncharacterized protein n=1 Tax=Zizania palustris TaxID=103762 RepID=A0A8J5WZL2_ZIZPA|nr:hypothetical protein GUJ93_ZPchr0013g34031 [Zizania palustris]